MSGARRHEADEKSNASLAAAASFQNVKDGERRSSRPKACREGARGRGASDLDADPLRQVFVLDRVVALTGACFERRTIEYGDPTAAIADDTPLL